MKITGFIESETDYTTGYAENGFIVYGMISKQNTTGFTQPEILQSCYKQVRNAVAYENARLTAGKSISIPYIENVNDADFIPDIPQVFKVAVSGTKFYSELETAVDSVYTVETLDQYGDAIETVVLWQTSNGAIITDGSITIEPVTAQTEFSITATATNGVSGTIDIAITPQVIPTLEEVKQRKLDEIKTIADSNLTTFKSSALGSQYTYLSGMNDMLLLTGEYAFVKGSDYNGIDTIMWYTLESGNLIHSGEQFIAVYLDARANVQTVKYHQAMKNAQTDACTSIAQVDTIGWLNPNPPTVPSGLIGAAGITGSEQVALNWITNSDVTMIGSGGYNIYVDGVKVNTSLITAATYIATGLTVGTHTFAITSVDTDDLESMKCTDVSVNVV